MGGEAWLTLGLVACMVAAMALGRAPDLVLLGGVALLLAFGVLEPGRAFVGFSNEGVLSVAALFVVAAGIRETGALDLVARRMLGRPRSVARAQLRLMLPLAGVSAFLNNTPIVAVAVPLVLEWARRIGVSPSRLLLPLSYATILGGTCTLIGTSTNLVVHGLALDRGLALGLFEIAWVGLPVAAVGLAYVVLASPRLLPERSGGPAVSPDLRDYGVRVRVQPDSPVVGRTIEAAGLRQLPNLYLAEIERNGATLAAVGPETVLAADDRLLFVGVVEGVADLRRVKGLVPIGDEPDDASPPQRRLVEAVVAVGSSLVGRSVREIGFRTRYEAVVVAVHR